MKLKTLTLRWKILVAMLCLSVIPLVVSLFFLSGLVTRQLDKDLQDRALGVVTVANKHIEVAQRELANYVQFLSRNTDLVNAIYYASLTGDAEQIKRVVEGIQQGIHLDLTVVLDKAGNVLLQSAGEGIKADNAGANEIAMIQKALAAGGKGSVERYGNRLVLLAVTPVQLQQDQIGVLAALIFLDEDFVAPLKKAVGAEVAFYDKDKIEYASLDELKQIDVADLIADGRGSERIKGADYSLNAAAFAGGERGMVVAIDNSDSFATRRNFRLAIVVMLVLAGGVSLVVGMTLSRGIVRPLSQVVGNLREIAEGEGDLTMTLEVTSHDEVGVLAENFNRFVERLREMVRRTRAVSADLNAATGKIRASSREVNAGAVQQSQSLEESFRAIQGIEGSVSGIAESTGSLVEAAEESSSATLELGATIEEIANQMEKLFSTVDEVSSSINQMSVSSQEIAENVEILSSSAEVTASSITELDASIKEIEENAEKTSRLSEEAAQDAQKGKEAVDETIQGIGAIREMVDRAGTAIQELGNQSNAIGKILTVIDEVADQTSLLALNAAIIAAQAGEHGRGFAVVADEIRELAERTAVSTREIASIINNLQNGTRDAVRAMTAGSERVHQEVERSKGAGLALEKIRTSTLKAREQVSGIVRATQEQSRGSRQITNSINQVASMLDQIASAIKQQTDGTRQLARAAEAMKEIAAQGKLSTGEQAKGSRQINLSMERIRSMIERIDEATREQTQRSRQVVEAVSSIRQIAEATASRTAEMDQVVDSLLQQTAALEEEVGAFKV